MLCHGDDRQRADYGAQEMSGNEFAEEWAADMLVPGRWLLPLTPLRTPARPDWCLPKNGAALREVIDCGVNMYSANDRVLNPRRGQP